MKKLIIGAIVGGLLIFIWQSASFTFLNLHGKAHQYTGKQDAIMEFLQSQFPESGQYFLPNLPENATMEQREALMKDAAGKPWAMISYHTSMDTNMVMNMVRGFLVNVVMVGLLCWILSRMTAPGRTTVFLSTLFTGLIVFFNAPYTAHIWYQSFDLMAHFLDAIVAWGLCGIWLSRWYGVRK